MILGPKHKPVERMAIYQPTTQDLLTDPKDILATTLKYKVGFLKKKKTAKPEDMGDAKRQNDLHDKT